MKVVITGGGGFLGFKLANALLARGKLTGPDGGEHESRSWYCSTPDFQTRGQPTRA